MLIEQIDRNRTGNLSSAIREFVLREYLDYYKRQQVGTEEEVA